MATNKGNFLKWLQTTIVGFCADVVPDDPVELGAWSWLRAPGVLPLEPNWETNQWMSNCLDKPIDTPALALPWLVPVRNGQYYHERIAQEIETLLARDPKTLTPEEKEVWDWFNNPKEQPKATDGNGDMGVPRPVRDWVKRRLPPPVIRPLFEVKTSVTGNVNPQRMGVIITDGKQAVFVVGSLEYDMLQALMALDCASRIRHPVGRHLLHDATKAVHAIAVAMKTPPVEAHELAEAPFRS